MLMQAVLPEQETSSSDERPSAVVIGSGFGGLAAAVRLGAKGYRVTVLEKLDGPGGRARTFEHEGHRFDAGPTIVTAPYLFEELWSLAGKRLSDHVELRALDPFYRIQFDDGTVFNYSASLEGLRAEVARFDPGEVAGLERYLARSKEIYEVAFEKLADKPFHDLLFTAGSLAELVRLRGYKTVYGTICDYFKNPYLRIVFSFHPLLVGGNPFRTTAYYCLIAHLERAHGVHYAVGGTGALVRGLVELIEGQGNRLRFGEEVEEILVEKGRARGVRLKGGEVLEAALVVSNADSAWTYSRLLAKQPRKRWSDAKLKRQDYSMGLFLWYFGTDKRFEEVYHHTILMGPRYKGLLGDIFQKKRLSGDFSLYLHRPTASDPSLAPPGRDSFYALVPVPHLGGGTDWSSEAEPFRQAVERRLEETLLPGLKESVTTSRVLTPADFESGLNSVLGAGFSLEPKLLQSAWFRPHNLSEEVAGLYLVGAGTHPGAGLPGVLSSAKIVGDLVPEAVRAAAAHS
ncbi:phytoene desaturase [Limibacillus halophilus]